MANSPKTINIRDFGERLTGSLLTGGVTREPDGTAWEAIAPKVLTSSNIVANNHQEA
jgi:hypothetical protein